MCRSCSEQLFSAYQQGKFWAAIQAQGLYLTLLVETNSSLKAQNLLEDLLVHVSVRELPVTNNG